MHPRRPATGRPAYRGRGRCSTVSALRQVAWRHGDQADVTDCPDFRLTVRRSTVLATDWHPWLVSGGPMAALLHARSRAGIAIADVTVIREEDAATEALVGFLAGD